MGVKVDNPFQSRQALGQYFPKLKAIPHYPNVPAMFANESLDATVVAVPHDQYLPIIYSLYEAKIPFMKEKPFARNLSEAEEMLKIPDFDKLAFICVQRRYNKMYREIKEAVANLGEIYLFTALYQLSVPNPHEGWRGSIKQAGGGCILDMGYHLIDLVTWWFGTPDSVWANGSARAVPEEDYDAEDTATILFRYRTGLHGTMVLTRFAEEKREEFTIHGTNAVLSGGKTGAVMKDREGRIVQKLKPEDHKRMFDRQLAAFVSAVRQGSGFAAAQREQLANMKFIERAYRGPETANPVYGFNYV